MPVETIVAELRALQDEQGPLLERLAEIHVRRTELLGPAVGATIRDAEALCAGVDDDSALPEVVVHKGVELGCLVSLDEDVYEGAHVPPWVYIFEEFDSEAPAESNCTLVDRANGDWTVRGIGELVPVDEDDTALSSEDGGS
jgi:hypothetical protein